jgi:hypothetical protein
MHECPYLNVLDMFDISEILNKIWKLFIFIIIKK